MRRKIGTSLGLAGLIVAWGVASTACEGTTKKATSKSAVRSSTGGSPALAGGWKPLAPQVAFALRLRLGLLQPVKSGAGSSQSVRPMRLLVEQVCRSSRLGLNPCEKKSRTTWGLSARGWLVALALAPQQGLEANIRSASILDQRKLPPLASHTQLARKWPPGYAAIQIFMPLERAAAFHKAFAQSSACKEARAGFTGWIDSKKLAALPDADRERLSTSRNGCHVPTMPSSAVSAALAPPIIQRAAGIALTEAMQACFVEKSSKRIRCDEIATMGSVMHHRWLGTVLEPRHPDGRRTGQVIVPTDFSAQVQSITNGLAKALGAFLKLAAPATPPANWLSARAAGPDLEIQVQPAALARLDAAFGLVQLFQTLRLGRTAKESHRYFGIGAQEALRGWRLFGATTDLLRDFRLAAWFRGARRELRLTWRLTPLGVRLLGPLAKALVGRNLARSSVLLTLLKQRLAVKLVKAAPTPGVLGQNGEIEAFTAALGPYRRLLLLARIWPDLVRTPAGRKYLNLVGPELKRLGFRAVRVSLRGNTLELLAAP